MKICSRCKHNLEDSAFRMRYDKRGRGSKALSYLNNTCRKCDSEISNKQYFHKKDDPGFLENWRKKSREYSQKNKEIIKQKNKIKRQTPEYKKMVRDYRAKNKEKISKQEKITRERYARKNTDNLTDTYIIQKLIAGDKGITTKEAAKIFPKELIEAKRLQILLKRKIKNNGN
jgi:hypothetical protein